jgi:hypothetical protein
VNGAFPVYSISAIFTNVFIYIKGKSILPSGSFQQTTRTRYMKEPYYFCNCKSKQAKYRNIDDVIENYDNIEQMSNNLNIVRSRQGLYKKF